MQLVKEMENLNQLLIKMSDSVEENINAAFAVYNRQREPFTINDDIVDQYERLIEEICLDILVKERLYSKDLSEITGIIKLVADLERIGDHAEDIMEYSIKLVDIEQYQNIEIDLMVTKTLKMVHDSIESIVRRDIVLAKDVIDRDDEIDGMFAEVIENLTKLKNPDGASIAFAIYTTLVVKYIERIADHAVNIAEWAIFMVNGFYKDRQIY